MTTTFAVLFFLSLLLRGYLFGRYHEVRIDGLKVGYIPTFVGVAWAVLAHNFNASWWLIPLAPSTAFLVGECFAHSLTIGRRHSGKYQYPRVLIPKDYEQVMSRKQP